MTRRSQHLGLVVDERSLRAADATGHVAEVAIDDATRSDPAAIGRALRDALDKAGIASRSALVGVPGRWLAVRRRPMPPAAGQALAGAVTLAAEREFPGQSEHLLIDYTPAATTADAPNVLICALPADRLAWLQSILTTAHMNLTGVTPTAATSTAGLTLHLAPHHCELSQHDAGRLIMLHHLGVTINGAAKPGHDPAETDATLRSLTAEVRRAVAMLDRPTDSVQIEDSVGINAAMLTRIGEQLAMPVHRTANGSAGHATMQPRFAPAARLATMDAQALPLDFTQPRTRQAQPPRVPRWARWAIAFGALALLIAVAFGIEVMMMQRTLAAHTAWETHNAVQIARAETLRDDLRITSGWTNARPPHLETLRNITLAFPERGDVWASSVILHETGRVDITGRARNERDVLDMLRRIQATPGTPGMAGAKLVYLREADARTREVAFAINLPAPQEGR